jgi:hypothetical protein
MHYHRLNDIFEVAKETRANSLKNKYKATFWINNTTSS